MLVLNLPFKALMFLTLMRPSLVLFLVLFFFSSRRRHTRSTRDWSSDVCSSDLMWQRFTVLILVATFLAPFHAWGGSAPLGTARAARGVKATLDKGTTWLDLKGNALPVFSRSEERRVGKERSCRRGAGHGKGRNE